MALTKQGIAVFLKKNNKQQKMTASTLRPTPGPLQILWSSKDSLLVEIGLEKVTARAVVFLYVKDIRSQKQSGCHFNTLTIC